MIVNEALPVISDRVLGGIVSVVVSTALIVMYVGWLHTSFWSVLLNRSTQILRNHPAIRLHSVWARHRRQHGVVGSSIDFGIGESPACMYSRVGLTCIPGHHLLARRKVIGIHVRPAPRDHVPPSW